MTIRGRKAPPAARGAGSSAGGRTAVMWVAAPNGERPPTVILRGQVAGADLFCFGEILDRLGQLPGHTVYVDLGEVDSWSLVAQAMVLSMARRMTQIGGQLVLYDPSGALRENGGPMHVFDRVPTLFSAS